MNLVSTKTVTATARARTQPRTGGARASALLGLAALIGAVSGCASVSVDAGFSEVRQRVQQTTGSEIRWARREEDRVAIDTRLKTLLGRPLDIDAAVQVALLNNRGLQAALDELGIAEADRARAFSLPNPGIGVAGARQGEERTIEWSVHWDLARVIALPWLKEVETQRLAQLQADTALKAFMLAADTRRAWTIAVGAAESLRYARQVAQAADASAELARRMAAAGNFNRLQHAREQAFQADASLGLARAEQQQRASREKLIRLLGLWGDQTAFALPDRLPDLPERVAERPDIEAQAIAQRLDVQSARLAAEKTARSLGLVQATRFVNVFEMGLARERSNEAPLRSAWEVRFELPVFDSGEARLARAEAVYRQALNRAAEIAINARSEVRESYTAWRSSWEVARYHRTQIVPLRQRIAEENLLRYNGMLIGVFELLADARAQIASVNAAIEANRDFWLAQTDLDLAMLGRPPSGQLVPVSAQAKPAEAAAHGAGH